MAFSAAGAADEALGRVGRDDGGFVGVVHGHGEDGQHESGITVGMLRANDGESVHLRAAARVGGAERSRSGGWRGARFDQAVDGLHDSAHGGGRLGGGVDFGTRLGQGDGTQQQRKRKQGDFG